MQKKLKRRKRTLTPKQLKLCENFVKFNDKEKAYRVSGYKGNGNHKAYIEKLFDKPEVKDYIKQLKEQYQPDLSNLKPKYQLFVKDYLTHWNASKAYYDHISQLKGASLYSGASQLLNSDQIREALNKEMAARCEKFDIEGDRLVRMLTNIANNDPDGLLNDLSKLQNENKEIPKPLSVFKIVKTWSGEVEDGGNVLLSTQETEERRDVAISDRNKAIELLMKYKGMLIDQHNIRGQIDHNVKAGVMKVPGMLDEDNWLKAVGDHATYQQKLLEENNANSDS